jgi:GNAT superfamily N-acetyltransferase
VSRRAAPRDRAIAFLAAVEDACAEVVLPCPGGHAVLDSRHPLLWSANHLRVEADAIPPAGALDAAAAHHLDRLAFRMITVLDEAVGRGLAGPLEALGYTAEHDLLMVLGDRPVPAPGPDPRVVEVDAAALRATRIAAQVELGRDPEVGRQLSSRDGLLAGVVAVRSLAVLAAGEIAARCQIFRRGGVVQIENVYTAPAHRRHGLSRLLVGHAVHEARSASAELVFLVADAGGWPQDFYRRLGFVDTGLLPGFRRAG